MKPGLQPGRSAGMDWVDWVVDWVVDWADWLADWLVGSVGLVGLGLVGWCFRAEGPVLFRDC